MPHTRAFGRLGGPAAVPLLVLLLALSAGGCEEDVVAVTGTEQPFTVFGVLTPQRPTQSVFVFPIEGRLTPTPPVPLDAQVTSTDLGTGDVVVWRDSLVQSENGLYAHAYWAPFVAAFGHDYRLAVTRPDGAASSVVVAVPPETSLILPPQRALPPVILEVEVFGAAPNLIRIEVVYEYKYVTAAGVERTSATVSYEGQAEPTIAGWRIPIQTTQDLGALRRILEDQVVIDSRIGLKVMKITIRLIVANAAWKAPGGVFDPEVLVQPGTLSNIDNGFGFLGAGYRHEGTWIPLDTLIVLTNARSQ